MSALTLSHMVDPPAKLKLWERESVNHMIVSCPSNAMFLKYVCPRRVWGSIWDPSPGRVG
jgi:hypothetical protein